jgi:hypothetical protein
MESVFKHIGIQVLENDIEPFYMEILNFKIKREFQLSDLESNELFGINRAVHILYGYCGEFEIELFINKNQHSSFAHLCISSDCVDEIREKAIHAGYREYKRKNSLFLSDSNYNVFEIKEKENKI